MGALGHFQEKRGLVQLVNLGESQESHSHDELDAPPKESTPEPGVAPIITTAIRHPLQHLVANIPDWLERLEQFNGQVQKRQRDLAQLAESQAIESGVPAAKSLRNKGSQESLKPHDEPEAHPRESTPQPEVAPTVSGAPVTKKPAPGCPSESQSPSAVARQLSQARAAGQARARVTLRRRQRSDSVVSAEGAAPKYRTRSMIIVYYDSYVQLFFEDLVKFISASRNMMRKAKMAAKVAQIKRLAELEMPDESEEEEAEPSTPSPADGFITPLEAAPTVDKDAEEQPPSFRCLSSTMQSPGLLMARAALARSQAGAGGRYTRSGMGRSDPLEKDIYDVLDKGLEFIQSICERAAHQVLLIGDCDKEVGKISSCMVKIKELAGKELERVQREDPDALKAAEDESRGRSYRPPSMRKDLIRCCRAPPTTKGHPQQ